MNNINRLSEQEMQEFRDRMENYNSWRWNGVNLYQSIFIVFITAAILIFVDLISQGDLILKIVILILLTLFSFNMYHKMLKQTQKPIAVCKNMIGTLENEPEKVKTENGEEYAVLKLSGIHHNSKIKEVKNERNR